MNIPEEALEAAARAGRSLRCATAQKLRAPIAPWESTTDKYRENERQRRLPELEAAAPIILKPYVDRISDLEEEIESLKAKLLLAVQIDFHAKGVAKYRVSTLLNDAETRIDQDSKSLLSTLSPTPNVATTFAYKDNVEHQAAHYQSKEDAMNKNRQCPSMFSSLRCKLAPGHPGNHCTSRKDPCLEWSVGTHELATYDVQPDNAQTLNIPDEAFAAAVSRMPAGKDHNKRRQQAHAIVEAAAPFIIAPYQARVEKLQMEETASHSDPQRTDTWKPGPYSIGSDLWPGLSKVVEETGELSQVIGKLMGAGGELAHWDGTNILDRLHEELADVSAAIDFLITNTQLDRSVIVRRMKVKRETFQTWHDNDSAKNASTE